MHEPEHEASESGNLRIFARELSSAAVIRCVLVLCKTFVPFQPTDVGGLESRSFSVSCNGGSELVKME